jgi:NADH:ubiquinone oxidoreductase subunit
VEPIRVHSFSVLLEEANAAALLKVDVVNPIYHVPHHANKTGTPSAYAPKGAWQNPRKRSWKKVNAPHVAWMIILL